MKQKTLCILFVDCSQQEIVEVSSFGNEVKMMTREYFIDLATDLTHNFQATGGPEDLLHGGGIE